MSGSRRRRWRPSSPAIELIITHGNGPQVGLLALQGAAYNPSELYPLDVLGAETEGMIGYMIEQELGNLLPFEVPFATVLTMVEVDPRRIPPSRIRPSSSAPSMTRPRRERLKAEKGWAMKMDGDKWRRVVPSPRPKRIFEMRPIKWLLEKGTVVIAAGGGGIPTAYEPGRKLSGVEAVIDKDLCSELLARELDVDLFIMATDADGGIRQLGQTGRQRRSAARARRLWQPTNFPQAPWVPRSTRPATSPRSPASVPRSARWAIWPR